MAVRRLFTAALMTLTLTLLVASPAHAYQRQGTVECISQRSVVGIWVEVSGGGSGWAGWQRTSVSYQARWWYDVPSGRAFRLHVGCGGTPQKWGSDVPGSWTSSQYTWWCRDFWYYGNPPYCYPG